MVIGTTLSFFLQLSDVIGFHEVFSNMIKTRINGAGFKVTQGPFPSLPPSTGVML